MKKRNFLRLNLTLGLGLLLRATLQHDLPAAHAAEVELLVSVAASLQNALEVLNVSFEDEYPEINVTYNFGSSGALQQQIEQGAPVDVFISAGVRQMDALEAQNLLLTNSRIDLLGNRLVLVTPADSVLELADFDDLSQNAVERIAVGEFRSVPAGIYAEQVLSALNIISDIQAKLIFANNVRGVLTAVESGNVDAGIVYATDAAISDQVTVVATAAENLHDPIVYPVAIISDSTSMEAAQTFISFLSSDSAKIIFEDFGFTVLD